MADHQVDRVFQAINGAELAELIAAEVRRQCLADPHFKLHLTYPLVSFAFNLVVTAYPMDPGEFTLRMKGQYKRASASVIKPDDVPQTVMVAGEVNIDAPAEGGLAPDEARACAGLTVTAPTRPDTGGPLVDTADANLSKPPEPPAKMEDPAVIASATPSQRQAKALADQRNQPAQTNANVPRNRAGASPRMARSVDLTTAATEDAPSVRVDENVLGGKR